MKYPKPTRRILDRVTNRHHHERAVHALRREVWDRDHGRCRCCDLVVRQNTADPLRRGHVHHLVFRSLSKALRGLEGVLLLCGLCHAKVHAHQIRISGNNANRELRFVRLRKETAA